MGQHQFTDQALPELKSLSSKERGSFCEEKVLQHFRSQGFKLVQRNQKIIGIEIDLIFYFKNYIMVEVKSLSSFEQIAFRLKKSQKSRLLRAREYFQSYKQEPVELLVAFVSLKEEVLVLDIADFE